MFHNLYFYEIYGGGWSSPSSSDEPPLADVFGVVNYTMKLREEARTLDKGRLSMTNTVLIRDETNDALGGHRLV